MDIHVLPGLYTVFIFFCDEHSTRGAGRSRSIKQYINMECQTGPSGTDCGSGAAGTGPSEFCTAPARQLSTVGYGCTVRDRALYSLAFNRATPNHQSCSTGSSGCNTDLPRKEPPSLSPPLPLQPSAPSLPPPFDDFDDFDDFDSSRWSRAMADYGSRLRLHLHNSSSLLPPRADLGSRRVKGALRHRPAHRQNILEPTEYPPEPRDLVDASQGERGGAT